MMPGKSIRPLGNENRMPETGKIKLGIKTGRAMKSISEFRFISNDRPSLEVLAAAYGGTITTFNDSKSQYRLELLTDASEIEVVLPPNPLGAGPRWKLFGGKGILRSCDAETCDIEQRGPEGAEMVGVPCICRATAKRECDPSTMLKVILPQCRLAGTWTLTTKSEMAAEELPTVVRMIEQAGAVGLIRAKLKIDQRIARGGTEKFVVPTLVIDHSIQELMDGAASLSGRSYAELPSPPPIGELTEAPVSIGTGRDDDVVDAEIVNDDKITDEQLERIKDLWAHLPTETAQKWVRQKQQEDNLPPRATDMTQAQATSFISILNRAFD